MNYLVGNAGSQSSQTCLRLVGIGSPEFQQVLKDSLTAIGLTMKKMFRLVGQFVDRTHGFIKRMNQDGASVYSESKADFTKRYVHHNLYVRRML